MFVDIAVVFQHPLDVLRLNHPVFHAEIMKGGPVYGLARGKEIKDLPRQVVLGEIVKGAFVEADLEGVVVLVKGNTTQKLSREEIASIGKASRGKGALLGLAGGAAVGAGMGALIGAKSHIGHGDVRALAAVTVLGISTGVGTGIGAAIGAEQTLWRAPKPQAKNTH